MRMKMMGIVVVVHDEKCCSRQLKGKKLFISSVRKEVKSAQRRKKETSIMHETVINQETRS
jgi:hypothetical protein